MVTGYKERREACSETAVQAISAEGDMQAREFCHR